MINPDEIAMKLVQAKIAYRNSNEQVLDSDIDCRIYIDLKSYREFIGNCKGKVSELAYELYSKQTLLGYKVYKVLPEDEVGQCIDIVVRKLTHD